MTSLLQNCSKSNKTKHLTLKIAGITKKNTSKFFIKAITVFQKYKCNIQSNIKIIPAFLRIFEQGVQL